MGGHSLDDGSLNKVKLQHPIVAEDVLLSQSSQSKVPREESDLHRRMEGMQVPGPSASRRWRKVIVRSFKRSFSFVGTATET